MSGPIPIRNVYVMLAYAFSTIQSSGQDHFEAEKFEHLHELFAAILIDGVSQQVKRGLQHGYVNRNEELATVRGRIDVTRTATQRTLTRGRLVCEHDEYEPDTVHNRALKAVMTLLIRHGAVSRSRRVELRNFLPYFTEVRLIDPAAIQWNTLTYHRGISGYRLLLGVCELVARGLLQGQASGDAMLSAWLTDEKMHKLYERFLLNYFKVHHPELKPAASKIPWDKDEARSPKDKHLPAMNTDLVLRAAGRTLIVDAKYYGNNLQVNRFGKETVISENLYQILSYVRNEETRSGSTVGGWLLNARTGAPSQPDLDVTIHGNRILANTLDLNLPWEKLRAQLENIVTEFWPAPVTAP
ncbi:MULTISPECIES: 5-methylcytosine-specific restriction endonuclease system specificity protein McrC [Arthrobacter]|uniref:5-methylcytosine-specific restriction endonuclease system specificity protein McrC n=2 Tax=Arthrobacter TaxID=1663 RepID=A0ABU9KF90_9MICC|nr:5-methylcytosine-specific restriction endonuclease system specificity protein McrC [Arthrobacter sp. YJM1]MDP5225550.1 5-methylcytosine-specific restriction endonuclease system specificity protein McrC [Arthrobacter sp. YJM1]